MSSHKLVKIYGQAFSGDGQQKLGVAVSGTDTYYSLKVPGPEESGRFSLHIGWTGTPTGTLTLWWSNLPQPDETDDDDWVNDSTWDVTDPAGSASAVGQVTGNLTASWVRLKYVNAAGSGTLWAWMNREK